MSSVGALAVLGVAVICEVFGDSMMKYSDGFKRKAPIIGIVVGYAASFYLMAQSLNHLPLGFAYAVWTGLGIALTAIVGAIVWKEGFNLTKLAGVVIIIAGVVLMEMGV